MDIEKQMSLVGKEVELLSFLRERRDEIGKAVFNSIGKIEVKKRVLDVISRLQKDYWLEEDIKNYQNAIDKEHSWFDTPTFLNWYAHRFKPANFLEVGVRRGRSMSQVLVESPETKVYGFSHDTLSIFLANPDNQQQFELINIDGDHRYEDGKLDLDIAFEHLAPGGALVFDDINHHAHPELKILWNEYKTNFSDYIFIEDDYIPGTGIAFRPPFDKLEKILIHNDLNKLRLLLVYSRHPKYDKVTLPEWIKESFREYFSYNVEVFACGPENEINISDSPDFYDHVSKVVNDLNIDAIWDIEGGAKSLEFMFRRFPTKISVPKIYWAVDTHQFLSLQVEKAKYFDFIFSVNKNALSAFGTDAFWLPAGASLHEKDHLLKRDINIGFIGNINYGVHDRRKKILARLYREIQNFNIYSEVFFEEKTKLASRMKIMINISANNDINLRVFETLACGAMLITDKIYNNGFEYLFVEGKHLVTFETEDELIEKIKYYLNHDKERIEIARAGQDRVNAFFRHNVMLKNVIFLINQLVEKHRQNSLKQEQNNVDTLVNKTRKISNTAKIVVDGIFFQINNTGIARIWKTLFEEWANDGFAKNIVVLDRAGTSPKISRVRYITVPPYDYNNTDADRVMLQKICDAEKADLFVSTYYTTPLSTPSVFMAYDMVPEMTGANLASPMWKEKHYGIYHACFYFAISENTAYDLRKFFSYIPKDSIVIAYCGIEKNFSPVNSDEISIFKAKYGISKPYFLLVGDRLGFNGYKNAILFFKAFSMLDSRHEFEIVCIGGTNSLEPEFVHYASGIRVHLLKLSDDELRNAYSGAIALVYPSKYEGFGLPIAEAMACGCPVITCKNASIPEVAGNAALYVNENDVDSLLNLMKAVQMPETRKTLISAGLEQVKKFSWRKMADIVSSTLSSLSEKISIGKTSKEPLYISQLKQDIAGYRQNPSDQNIMEHLRQERRRNAEMLLNTPKEKIEGLYQTYIGDAYNLLLTSGLQTIQPTIEDQSIVAKVIPTIQNCSIESILTIAYSPLIERNIPLIGNERIFISNILAVLQNGNYPSHLLQYLLTALLFLHIDIKRG